MAAPPPSRFSSPLARYGLALGAMLVALLARWALLPVLGTNAIYITLFPVMVIVAVSLGVGPGLLGDVLGILLTEVYLAGPERLPPLNPSLAVRAALMLSTTAYVGWLGTRLRRARAQADADAAAARHAAEALQRQVELVDSARAHVIAAEMQRVLRERAAPPAPPLLRAWPWLTRVPEWTGAAVAVLGVAVLAGWAWDVAALKSVLPGLATMKANTALCLVLLGTAVALRQRREVRVALAAGAGAVAALSLVEYAAGDLGVDQLLFRDLASRSAPGRMSEATAVGILLAAAALLLLSTPGRAARAVQQLTATGAALVGLVAVVGHALVVGQLYRFAGFSTVAPHTALALLGLGTALILGRRDGPGVLLQAAGPGAQLARRLVPAVILAPLVLAWLRVQATAAGLVGSELGTGLLAVGMVLVLAVLVGHTARLAQATDAARREAELHLRNQAEVINQAQEPLMVRELGGVIRSWNRGAEGLYGWSAGEALGLREHVLLRTQGAAPEEVDRTLERDGHWEGELTQTTRDGRTLRVEARTTATRAPDGRSLVLTSTQDITRRVQDTQQLRLLSTALESAANGVVITDRHGALQWVNPAFTALTGYSAAEVLGRNPRMLKSGQHPREFYAQLWATVLRGESWHGTVVNRRKDGSLYDEEMTVTPVVHQGQEPTHFVAIKQDVSERTRAAAELQRSRQDLACLAQVSLDVLAESRLEPLLHAIARAAVALTGARQAVCGHGLDGGPHTQGTAARESATPGRPLTLEPGGVHQALVDGAESIRLSPEQLPPGSTLSGGVLGVRMVAPSGRTTGVILVTDKDGGTEFTAADESLLRQLATVATLALRHVEARQSLEEANRAKSQFLAMLSHELRNPLAPIRNSLFLLGQVPPGSAPATRAISVMDRQVQHLTRLVDELLDMTRISRGKIQLHQERLDLAQLVTRTAEDHQAVFSAAGVELHVCVPAQPVWIQGDRTRLAQVLGNLLGNAVKFTDRGGWAQVSLEEPAGTGQAQLRVQDTGTGMAPEVLPRLFEPFHQADQTLDRSKGGLGLGLAMVKALTELHGGTVRAASAGLGQGAEFTVSLPVQAALQDVLAAPRFHPSGLD